MIENEITSRLLESIPDTLTLKQLSMLWSREVLRRNKGNRSASSEQLGVSYRSLLRYICGIKKNGMDVHFPDIAGRRPRSKNKKD
jgi:hypothetical protein